MTVSSSHKKGMSGKKNRKKNSGMVRVRGRVRVQGREGSGEFFPEPIKGV